MEALEASRKDSKEDRQKTSPEDHGSSGSKSERQYRRQAEERFLGEL